MLKFSMSISDSTISTLKTAGDMVSAAYPLPKATKAKEVAKSKAKEFISDVQDGVGAATYAHIGGQHETGVTLNDDFVNDGIMLMAKILIAISVPMMALITAIFGMVGIFDKISDKFSDLGEEFRNKWFPSEDDTAEANKTDVSDANGKKDEADHKYGLMTIVKKFDNGQTLVSVAVVHKWENGNMTIDTLRSNYMDVDVEHITNIESELQLRAKVDGKIDWCWDDSDHAKLAAIDHYNELVLKLENELEARREANAEKAKAEAEARKSKKDTARKKTSETGNCFDVFRGDE